MKRLAFVLFACGVGLCLVVAGSAKRLHAWGDLSLTALKSAAALETPVALDFDEVPLKTAVGALCEQANLEVVWDRSCDLDGQLAGEFAAGETVSLHADQPLALRRALALILEPCYLTWELQGDRQIRIGSRLHWNDEIVTVAYDVRALLKSRPADFDLPALIQAAVAPRDWQTEQAKVAGYILLVDGELQVTQKRSVQAEVAAFLAQLQSPQAGD